MLYDTEDNKEEASLRHKSELLSSKILESSDDENEEEDGTGVREINGNVNSDGDGGGDRNTGDGGGSTEWLRFLSPGAQTEELGAMAKAKESSLTASR